MLALSINIIETLSNFIIAVIEQLGYGGIFVGMTLESTGLPIPSEIVMTFAGYVVWTGRLTLIGVTLAGTLGCLAGSLIAYYIGLWGGRPLLERYGKYVLIRKSELDRAQKWFEKYGDRAVFCQQAALDRPHLHLVPRGYRPHGRDEVLHLYCFWVASVVFCTCLCGRHARAPLGGSRGTISVPRYHRHRGGGGAYRLPHLPQSVGRGTFG